MAIWKKIDVQGDPHPILWKCLGCVIREYAMKGVSDFFITSVREGTHALTSFHYIGMAVDFKRGGIQKATIEKAIKQYCNKYNKSVNDFDLIEYTDSRDIYHLEYDPK